MVQVKVVARFVALRKKLAKMRRRARSRHTDIHGPEWRPGCTKRMLRTLVRLC